jgi:hypothetical protein
LVPLKEKFDWCYPTFAGGCSLSAWNTLILDKWGPCTGKQNAGHELLTIGNQPPATPVVSA